MPVKSEERGESERRSKRASIRAPVAHVKPLIRGTDCQANQSQSHLHLRICRVCSAPLPNQTSCPLTSFRGRVTLFLARTALLIGSLCEEAVVAAAAAACRDLEPFASGLGEDEVVVCCGCWDEDEDREAAAACCMPAMPQRGDSFMCIVISCRLRNDSLHQTHVNTSRVCSLLRLIHCVCHGFCRP